MILHMYVMNFGKFNLNLTFSHPFLLTWHYSSSQQIFSSVYDGV